MMGDVSEAQKHPQFPYGIANKTCHFYLNQPLLLDRKHQNLLLMTLLCHMRLLTKSLECLLAQSNTNNSVGRFILEALQHIPIFAAKFQVYSAIVQNLNKYEGIA